MRVFFNCWNEAFGVTCVPRPEQLVRSTPLLPYGMPEDAKDVRWIRLFNVSRKYPFDVLLFEHPLFGFYHQQCKRLDNHLCGFARCLDLLLIF